MRILAITDAYYPSRLACAVRMKVLVEVLRKYGHDVQVLASDTSLSAAASDYLKPDYVHFFPVAEMEKKTVVNRLKNNLSGSSGAVKAARGLGRFDVVMVTSPPLLMVSGAMKVARIKQAKLIIDVRDIWPDVGIEMGSFTRSSPYARVFDHIANKAYRESSLVTTVSPGKKEKLKSRMQLDSRDKVHIVANGLDLDFARQEEDPEVVDKFELSRGPICSYVGNIGLAQGLETLLALARHRPDVRFLLFGEGACRKSLESRVKSERLENVSFCGQIDSRGVYTVLRHSTVSYVPLISSRLLDSIPTKMFEAMGCGCPVLLAARGDSVAVLDDIGLGIAVPPEDEQSLIAALNRLIDYQFSSGECARAAERVVSKYSRQAEAKKLNDLLLRIR